MNEGRNHVSGDNIIMTGGEDIYIHNPLFDNNQYFIANAKQDIPKLIAEIRKLKRIKPVTNNGYHILWVSDLPEVRDIKKDIASLTLPIMHIFQC